MIMGYFAHLRKTTISKFNITSTFVQEKISNGLQHSCNLYTYQNSDSLSPQKKLQVYNLNIKLMNYASDLCLLLCKCNDKTCIAAYII